LQPNILILMVDQLNGTFFPDGPAAFLHAPNLKRLAARSARFNANYCASPLCAPSRAAFMSGQLPSRTGVYDNAAEFPSSVPTFAHHLRRLGYRTVLSGKMHFVGPDQLHGFEERLTTDIYPADFGWTPDWTKPDERIDWWYHNLSSVTGAGVAEITNQLEYDDEVAHLARQRLLRSWEGRGTGGRSASPCPSPSARPLCECGGNTWDLYDAWICRLPEGGEIADAAQDPHSAPHPALLRRGPFPTISEDHVRAARRGLLCRISYLDEKDRRVAGDPGDLRLCRRITGGRSFTPTTAYIAGRALDCVSR
jgi:choline-sulfatase